MRERLPLILILLIFISCHSQPLKWDEIEWTHWSGVATIMHNYEINEFIPEESGAKENMIVCFLLGIRILLVNNFIRPLLA